MKPPAVKNRQVLQTLYSNFSNFDDISMYKYTTETVEKKIILLNLC